MSGNGVEAGDVQRAESTWREYAEDTTGFGEIEWRTARDLVIRPHVVLDAYVAGGPSGGGRYARPARFYLAMCGVLMFYLFLIGGNQRLMQDIPVPLIDALAGWSGKTRATFLTGIDGWLSILAVPVLAVFYTLGIAPLIKWWGGYAWRIAFRATLALLCAWTVPLLLLGPLPYLDPFKLAGALLVNLLLIVSFVRMGRGVWWRRPAGAVGKVLVVLVAITVSAPVGMLAVLGLAALGARLAA